MGLNLRKGRHVTSTVAMYSVYFRKKRKGDTTYIYLTQEGREFADSILKLRVKLAGLAVQKRLSVSPIFIGAKLIYTSKTLNWKFLRTHYYTMLVTFIDEKGNPTDFRKAKEAVGRIKCVDKDWKEDLKIPPISIKDVLNSPRIRTLFKAILENFEKAKSQSILVTETIIALLSLYPIVPVQIMKVSDARVIIYQGKLICAKCISQSCIHVHQTSKITRRI